MELQEFEQLFTQLGTDYRTADVDRLNKQLIRLRADVSCLRPLVLCRQEYHRSYFQVSLGALKTIREKFDFLEANFDLLQDWWHVDQLSQFVDKQLTFPFGLERARGYVTDGRPFVRRWGYVLFMPSLVKEAQAPQAIFPLLHNDEAYYVQMAQGWLLSYLAIYHPEETLDYLSRCPLDYSIAGKAIQKTCDSFRVSPQWKQRFRQLRPLYRPSPLPAEE